jgi:eukaryotic-like serine/threonine-protein kinase
VQRLRAAAALAKYDPDSEKWSRVQVAVANDLVVVPAVYLAPWLESLRPVREKLLRPLAEVYRDRQRRETERDLATDILADYAAEQPKLLADLLLDADEKQFVVLYPKLQQRSDVGFPILTSEIERALPAELPSSDENREKLAKRQANAAVALLRLNQPGKVWPLLKHHPDPRVRSYLIHRQGPMGADAALLVKRLDEEPDLTIRRALILSLGPEEFGPQAWTPEGKTALLERLQDLYRTASDPGLHAAAEWLLRQWQQETWLTQINEAWSSDKEQRQQRLDGIEQRIRKEQDKTPQWYVNGKGQTMVVIPGPLVFLMGSPPTEFGRFDVERQHRSRIGRTFAIAAKPVTLGEFKRYFRAVYKKDYDAENRFTPTDACPVNFVSWYEAAAYCNWLSKQEDLAECYEMDATGQVVKLKANYLSLPGYRLPTEAEMEYACRAGAVTSRYYGETEELLPRYAWCQKNSGERTWPVGGKKPNDLGLFDMHGNVYSWCQERFQDYSELRSEDIVEDKEDILDIDKNTGRALRCGSFYHQASVVRCAYHLKVVPSDRFDSVGIRPARTFIP